MKQNFYKNVKDHEYNTSSISIEKFSESDIYLSICKKFNSYPEYSLISESSRAILYHLLMTIDAMDVLEIGTYKAGTSELLAYALEEKGTGKLTTIDPYGSLTRVPNIISDWPDSLKLFVEYKEVSSALFFDECFGKNLEFDLIFIDGNHEYEFALFDIQASARILKPGCILVVDNIDQVGPRFAAIDFLDLNPSWTDLDGEVSRYNKQDPLSEPEPSFKFTKFYIIKKPSSIIINSVPKSFRTIEVSGEIKALNFEIKEPISGTLHFQIFYRAIGDEIPEEITMRENFQIYTSMTGMTTLRFSSGLEIQTKDAHLYTVEINMAFTSNAGRPQGDALIINSPPSVVFNEDE